MVNHDDILYVRFAGDYELRVPEDHKGFRVRLIRHLYTVQAHEAQNVAANERKAFLPKRPAWRFEIASILLREFLISLKLAMEWMFLAIALREAFKIRLDLRR